MNDDAVRALETLLYSEDNLLRQKIKGLGRQLKFANSRLAACEERCGELEATVDEMRHLLRQPDPVQPDQGNGQPVSGTRKRNRLLDSSSNLASPAT